MARSIIRSSRLTRKVQIKKCFCRPVAMAQLGSRIPYHFLCKGKYHCTADLMFIWFCSNQTSKYVNNFNIPILLIFNDFVEFHTSAFSTFAIFFPLHHVSPFEEVVFCRKTDHNCFCLSRQTGTAIPAVGFTVVDLETKKQISVQPPTSIANL